MTSSTASKARRARAAPPPKRPMPVLGIALLALVLVVAVGVVVAIVGGDDDPTTGDVDGMAPAFGEVTVDGVPLTKFSSTADDPAVGAQAPLLTGEAPDGTPAAVGGAGQPTIVAFLAHWCPHCQAELPILVDLEQDGAFDGVRTVALLTGTNPDAPNYPPADWLEREGWTGDVLLDDETISAATAYGLKGYPFLVALDAGGRVVARTSGELPAAQVEALADAVREGA